MLAIIMMCVCFIACASLLLTRQNRHNSHVMDSQPRSASRRVRIQFYTTKNQYLGSFSWTNSNADAHGGEVTDLVYNDLVDLHSELSTHMPHRYQYDQTNLKNVQNLRQVSLGDTVHLVVRKTAAAEQRSPYQRFMHWLKH